MPRYIVQHRYSSSRDGALWGPWAAGQPIDLRPEDAAWCNTDSPGLLVEYVEPEPDPEPAVEEADTPEEPAERNTAPAKDRMHRGGRRRTAGT